MNEYQPICPGCKAMYAGRTPPDDPPCDNCRVELADENREVAQIFRMVRGQVLTRFNGQYDEVADLNFPAVKIIMDLFGVKDQRTCFEKVCRVFYHFLNEKRGKE